MSRTHHSDSLWALLLCQGHITVVHWGHFCCVPDTSQWLTGGALFCPGHITVAHWGRFVLSRTHHSGSLGALCCVQDTSQRLTGVTLLCPVLIRVAHGGHFVVSRTHHSGSLGALCCVQDTSADNRCNQFEPTPGLKEPSVLIWIKTV